MEKKIALDLLHTLTNQSKVLDSVLEIQKLIRKAVTDKDWIELDKNLLKINENTDTFTQLDGKREALYRQICATPDTEKVPSIHLVSIELPEDLRPLIMDMFHEVRQKLSKSKIENDALNDYIRITKGFLQDVFDNVIPKNRNTVYSNKGTVVKPVPENILIDTVM